MRGTAEGEDFDIWMKRLFRFERGWEDSSPLLEFGRIVARRTPEKKRKNDSITRLVEAEAALRLLHCAQLATTEKFQQLVDCLPAPPAEIAVVYAALWEQQERAPGAVEGEASQLILAELCVRCCRAAHTLRLWIAA